MRPISAVLITKNEEKNILRCLESLRGIVDEIIVVDSYSDDATQELARQMGAKVIPQDWLGYSKTKNRGNEAAAHDLILSIDADEVLSEPLAESISAAKHSTGSAFTVNRLTNYCGSWIHHCGWYPDRKLRLFDRTIASWEGDYVHETLILKPGTKVEHLTGDLLHYSFDTISDHVQRIDRYSTLAAEALFKRGHRCGIGQLLLSPPLKFIKTYFLKRGVLDGYAGFLISSLSAFDVFVRYAKLRERSR